MRVALALGLVGVATTVAHADALWEFTDSRLRQAAQLAEASCDVDVQVRGAIVEVEVRERLVNRAGTPVAGAVEMALPPAARVIDLAVRDDRGTHAGLPVAAGFTNVVIDEDDVVGPDPAIAMAAGTDDRGWQRVRVVLAPIGGDRDLTLTTRWTVPAQIRDGALTFVLPGRGADSRLAACRGVLHAVPGPGASVARLRAGDVEIARDTAPFVIDVADVPVAIELAFGKPAPVVWEQSESLGAGWTAKAITVIAPPVKSLAARRVLLVIDGSRSMELVGAPVVRRVVKAVGAALPQGAQVEAIVYDRTPARVLGAWRPADAAALGAIDAAIGKHTSASGTDLAGALALAKQIVLDGTNDQALVVVITDGALHGGESGTTLVHALAANAALVDVHVIALEPADWHAPGEAALRAVVDLYGGTYVEVAARAVDDALAGLDAWLRPSWRSLELAGMAAPDQLLAGAGFVQTTITRAPRAVKLVGHGDTALSVAARPAPSAPIAQLALAAATDAQFAGVKDTELAALRARLAARHAVVDADHAIAVVADGGKVANHRRAMLAGGGRYARMVALDDPAWPADITIGTAVAHGGSAVDSAIVKRLLNDQLQPRAYTCYQHALGRAQALAGTGRFELELGRGEVIHATVTGIDDAAFAACLVDAAYGLSPPLPNPDYNVDDRVVITYPLTFTMRAEHPVIVAGDADSSSPLDIDAIEGGVPRPEPHIKRAPITPVDATTPLGNLRP